MNPVPTARLQFKASSESPFWRELQQAARAHLREHGDHRFFDVRSWLKAVTCGLAAWAAYALVLTAPSATVLAAAYLAFLFMSMMLGVNLLHDASHGAVAASPRVNGWCLRLVALPVGIEPTYWTARHVRFHHARPNVEGHDLDIEAHGVLRQTPFQPWRPWFRYQHLYWPVVAALSLPYLVWIGDVQDRLGRTPLATHRLLPGWRGWAVFMSAKLIHATVTLLIPGWALQAHGVAPGWMLALYLVGQMLASCVLVALILGTHWAEPAFFEPPPGGRFAHTWHEHSVRTTCDWRTRPAWLGLWLGGLNWHLTHHLFPHHSHRHHPALAALVAQTARRHGLPDRQLTHATLWRAQQRFLKGLGTRPDASAQRRGMP